MRVCEWMDQRLDNGRVMTRHIMDNCIRYDQKHIFIDCLHAVGFSLGSLSRIRRRRKLTASLYGYYTEQSRPSDQRKIIR